VLFLLTVGQLSFADSPAPSHVWLENRYRISLGIPSDFEAVKVEQPNVLLALRHRTTGEPTLNIIVEPGSFEVEGKWTTQRGAEVVSSYRRLGLTDVTLVESSIRRLGGIAAYQIKLRYLFDQSSPREATVLLLPSVATHFIVTGIDKVPSASPGSLDSLLSGIALSTPQATDNSDGNVSFKWLILLAAFLAVAFIWRGYRRI